MNKEEKIENEFNDLLDKMSDEQFWKYVANWKNAESIVDEMKNWDLDIKKEAIKEMKEVIKNG